MSRPDLDGLRAIPGWWEARVAHAHTITREFREELAARFDAATAAQITVPVLMLVGGDSPVSVRADARTVAAALPAARVVVLAEQQHIAHRLAPEAFARHVLRFLG